MSFNDQAGVQLIDGIIGACKFLRFTKQTAPIKSAILKAQHDEAVLEMLLPSELYTMSEMLKRLKQSFSVSVGEPGRDFTLEHFTNETLYVFDKTGRLIEIEHDYPTEPGGIPD